ncbi:hypothetical protein PG997_013589 [Apiospora hydei]|uniref:Uncharacterized protein n=1 Tax=Apiospora hydei TaxID=1337664 RepID=A0ABR1V6K3_9PEZI
MSEIEWIQANYNKMARKWIESEKQRLILQRRIDDLEVKQSSSPETLEESRPLKPGRRSNTPNGRVRQRKAEQRAKAHKRHRRASSSPPPSSRDILSSDILSSIESDDSWSVGRRDGELDDDTDSGGEGYRADSETAPRNSDSLSIAQQCFYHAALETWPAWTRDLFPQGAHEVSFGALDLLGYFAGYSVGDGDFAMRGASSREVFHALMGMTDLRNRTCHFPPRSDAHYLRMMRGWQRRRTPQTAAEEVRFAIEEQQGTWAGTGSGNWPFEPDCAGWYCEAMAAARNLARVLDEEAAMRALDDLYDRVEDHAWAMLRAIEDIAAFGGGCATKHIILAVMRRRRQMSRSTGGGR